jgi:hypothetical protein
MDKVEVERASVKFLVMLEGELDVFRCWEIQLTMVKFLGTV